LENPSRIIYAETEYPATLGWSALSSMRSGDAKLIAGVTAELFDLRRDPSESVNRWSDDRRTYRALAAQLDALRATAVAARAATVDAETRRKLASLGYIAPTGATNAGSTRDPRAMAALVRRYEEAMWTINAGRARDAIAPLEQLVRDDPSNHVFRETLARALRQSGDAKRALALYREAVALAPRDADSWYNLAAALEESGNASEAEMAIEEAAKIDPHRPELHNMRGAALAERGDLAGAAAEFRQTLSADPRNARAWNNYANVLRASGQEDEAAAAYAKAIEIAPSYADALNGMGAMLVQKGRAREALRYFDAALQAAPDLYEAQLNRAIALQVGGDGTAAASELRRLLARLPSGPQHAATRNAAQTLLTQLHRISTGN